MITSTSFDRLALVERLNWDYDVEPQQFLAVIDGAASKAGPFNAERLLVRSLERLSWYAVIALWGAERISFSPVGPRKGV